MKKKVLGIGELSPEEKQLIERLRQRPKMMARVESILEIARNEGELKSADEVEELLVEELRKLGNTAMGDWAAEAQEWISGELHNQEPGLRSRKKKR
jgi:hypothetical protein